MRPDRPLDPPPQTVELRRGPVSFTSTGSGRPVIAVHGMPATSKDYRWLDAAFAGRVRFIRVDLPGFGASPVAGHEGHTVEAFGQVTSELCEALELTGAVVLGHSMGGAIAVEAAALSPRISGLALVNSVGPMLQRAIFQRSYRMALALAALHPVVRRLTLEVTKPIAYAVGFSKRLSDEELIRATRTCADFDPRLVRERLPRLGKPVLVAWADDDRAIEPRVSRALVACAPNTQQVRFDTGGHNLQSSRASELADAIVAWACGRGGR